MSGYRITLCIWQMLLSKAMYDKYILKVIGTATEQMSDEVRFAGSISYLETVTGSYVSVPC